MFSESLFNLNHRDSLMSSIFRLKFINIWTGHKYVSTVKCVFISAPFPHDLFFFHPRGSPPTFVSISALEPRKLGFHSCGTPVIPIYLWKLSTILQG